jgi:integrase/recombinase XerD
MNGLRISEALGASIDDLDVDRGHRTLQVVRKGGKQATIPLAPRTARRSVGTSANGPPGLSSWAPPELGWIATPPIGP